MIKRSTKVISVKQKKLFKIDDIDANKILVSKKNYMAQKSQLNTLLGMIIMML